MPATICLIVINVLVFAAYLYQSAFTGLFNFDGPVLFKMGAAFSPNILAQHQYWRLLASLFLHANLQHICLNMLSLFIFGRMLEKPMGSARFLILYFVSGFFGGLASMGLHSLDESVGASGAILGLVGFYLTLQLQSDKKAHPNISYRIRQVIGMGLALYCLSLTPGVDNAAHIGGLIAGIICGVAFQKFSDLNVRWCWRDLAITAVMAALFVCALYGEERTIGQGNEMPAAILLHDSIDSLQHNDLSRALSQLDSALTLEPKSERALLLRSTIHLTLNHYPQALADITAALTINQSDAVAYNQRACIYLAMANYAQALSDARRAVELDSHSTAAMDTEAMALAYLGQMDQALSLINRAIDEDNGASGIYFYHRSNIYAAMGDSARAASDLVQANKHNFVLENWERQRPLPKFMPRS